MYFAPMKTMHYLTTLILMTICLSSCVKTPGEGGDASIEGSILLIRRVQINNPASTVDTIPASDVEVHIIYGEHTSPDDKVDTNPDGGFAFNWLRTGDYTLYVYSEDTSTTSTPLPKVAVSYEVNIEDRDDVVTLEPLLIYDEY
jgi:hypothetical protein|tara:strand:+ start:1396 stop:1827 length:432 start_codon:yes stop_codon:yes gene_type:complete